MVIPTLNEAGNIAELLPEIHRLCTDLGVSYEILVVDGGSSDATVAQASSAGAEVLLQKEPGYGSALREAFARAKGSYVATLDSDLSHPPSMLGDLYRARDAADILIASRFLPNAD